MNAVINPVAKVCRVWERWLGEGWGARGLLAGPGHRARGLRLGDVVRTRGEGVAAGKRPGGSARRERVGAGTKSFMYEQFIATPCLLVCFNPSLLWSGKTNGFTLLRFMAAFLCTPSLQLERSNYEVNGMNTYCYFLFHAHKADTPRRTRWGRRTGEGASCRTRRRRGR